MLTLAVDFQRAEVGVGIGSCEPRSVFGRGWIDEARPVGGAPHFQAGGCRGDVILRFGIAAVNDLEQAPHERAQHRVTIVGIGQDDRPDPGLGNGEPVALVTRHAPAVMDHLDPPGFVGLQTHPIAARFADRNIGLAPLEDAGFGHELPAVGQTAAIEFEHDVLRHVVRIRPRPSGWPIGVDDVFDFRIAQCRPAIDVRPMRRGVVPLQRQRGVECGVVHSQRRKDPGLHCPIERRTDLHARIQQMAADKARGGRHQVVVLIDFAEAAGWFGCGELGERARGGSIAAGREDEVEILARQSRARADEVADQDLRGRLVASQAKAGVEACHRLVPSKATRVDQARQQQSRQPLGIRCDLEQRARVDRRRVAQRPDTGAAFVDDAVAIDQGKADARHAQFARRLFDERPELGDPRRIEFTWGSAREALLGVARRPQALSHQLDRAEALFSGRGRTLGDEHRPPRAAAQGHGANRSALVGRDVIGHGLPFVPSVARRSLRDQLYRPTGVRPIKGPGLRCSSARIGSIASFDDRELEVPFRGGDQRDRALRRQAPALWRGKRCPCRGRCRSVLRQSHPRVLRCGAGHRHRE